MPFVPFNSLELALRQQRQLAQELCRNFTRAPSRGNLNKIKQLFASCGEDVFIETGFHCDYGDKISVGERVYFNINCTLLDGGRIDIGNDCLIGPNVQFLTVNHALNPAERLLKQSFAQDITLEENIWVGAGAIILQGITIQQGSVIAAGSVVTKNVPPNTLVGGNPAIPIKSI